MAVVCVIVGGTDVADELAGLNLIKFEKSRELSTSMAMSGLTDDGRELSSAIGIDPVLAECKLFFI